MDFLMKKIVSSSIFLSLVGLLDASYLTWMKFTHHESACMGVGDCYTVNMSKYSTIHGIPIALLGFGAYLVILLALLFEEKHPFLKENASLIVFGISLAGVVYSAYLSYLEEFVLHAWCPYCVISAIVITLIFFLSLPRLKSPE